MRNIALLTLAIVPFLWGTTQAAPGVGVGTDSPHASALLDVTSTVQGLLVPRLTTNQRDKIKNPAEGLVIYNTGDKQLQVYADGAWKPA